MDTIRFDCIVATLSEQQSRRGALRALGAALAAGGITALAGLGGDAKRKKRKNKGKHRSQSTNQGSDSGQSGGGSGNGFWPTNLLPIWEPVYVPRSMLLQHDKQHVRGEQLRLEQRQDVLWRPGRDLRSTK